MFVLRFLSCLCGSPQCLEPAEFYFSPLDDDICPIRAFPNRLRNASYPRSVLSAQLPIGGDEGELLPIRRVAIVSFDLRSLPP